MLAGTEKKIKFLKALKHIILLKRPIDHEITLYLRYLRYIDANQGTKPRPTIYCKDYYKQKHYDEVRRSPRNPDKSSQYEWFVPLPKNNKPDYSR